MTKKRGLIWLLAAVIMLSGGTALTSCGSMHSYWGVENDYYSGDDYGHHHKKHKKHKKYKKYKIYYYGTVRCLCSRCDIKK